MISIEQDDKEKIELFLSCRRLANKDVFSKSDPYVKIYMGKAGGGYNLIGQTETIQDNLNPNFSKSIVVDYVFEIKQPIKFEVWDYDSPTSSDFIGAVETTVGAIVGAKNQTVILDLKDKYNKDAGKAVVRAEKVGSCRQNVVWQWVGVKLMNTDGWFDKSDPLLRFFKRRENEWLKVHETEVIMNNLNPIWKTFKIKGERLYGGDLQRPIRVECWDWEKSGNYQYIGDCEFNMNEIIQGKRTWDLSNPKKKKKTGTLKLNTFAIEEKPEFIDYIRGGEQLSVSVAIDFTGSNGIPTQPSSLHAFKYDGSMNEYQRAIHAVCDILLHYDHDKQIPVYGFGGKPRFPMLTSTQTLHCFPCTGNPNQQNVMGLQGIMEAYAYALKNVELSGPTLFAPLIKESMKIAEYNKQNGIGVYSILLILTDGEIHDMRETIELVVAASYLPLSIIIVGVGSSDFGSMETLDGDAGLYNAAGKKAARDLVQFVPFRKYSGNQVLLAQEVLAEVPDQLVGYMQLMNRKPNPPNVVDLNTILKPVEQNTQLMNLGTNFIQGTMLAMNNQTTVQTDRRLTDPLQQATQQPMEKRYTMQQTTSTDPNPQGNVLLKINFDDLKQQQQQQQNNYPNFNTLNLGGQQQQQVQQQPQQQQMFQNFGQMTTSYTGYQPQTMGIQQQQYQQSPYGTQLNPVMNQMFGHFTQNQVNKF